MRKKVVLITGASGEVGQALVETIGKSGKADLLTFDLNPLPEQLRPYVLRHVQGDLLDTILLGRLVTEYEIDTIYHLAAMLSKSSEFRPDVAHQVNVSGTLGLLRLASEQSQWRERSIQFLFPSSIAVYGMPEIEQSKSFYNKVREWEWNQPRTMYGCNKLYCENLGVYYSQYLRQMASSQPVMVDFRSVRFPGLISAHTVPTGGTSDFAPEMLHAAAQAQNFICWTRADTRIPFMAMPDAAHALLELAHAPLENLSRRVYNVTSFSPSAQEVASLVQQAFPNCEITYQPDNKRQAILDSWPADLDDSAARKDWGWQPQYDLTQAFSDYLIPVISQRYQRAG